MKIWAKVCFFLDNFASKFVFQNKTFSFVKKITMVATAIKEKKVVWWIFPRQEVVYVFTNNTHAVICRREAICSASPVLPDFQLTANSVFQKPKKP
jgi:ribosome biogenesis protein Nip4